MGSVSAGVAAGLAYGIRVRRRREGLAAHWPLGGPVLRSSDEAQPHWLRHRLRCGALVRSAPACSTTTILQSSFCPLQQQDRHATSALQHMLTVRGAMQVQQHKDEEGKGGPGRSGAAVAERSQ